MPESKVKSITTVRLDGIGKSYGSVRAVDEVDLTIGEGEFLVLLGPSGCGKSTTLRMIAGLESITTGTLIIGDKVMNNVEPKDRGVAMVFQNYALYPHKSVFENMSMALKLQKVPAVEIRERVGEVAVLLGLTEYLDRKPAALSGGQRQRVAIGRAIVRTPDVFLFDEPLSNLDAKLRVKMRMELQDLHKRLGVTSVYVTHDQVEAMTLADRIVIMKDGVVVQVGTPREVYDQPADVFVAGFIGSPSMNFIDLKKKGDDGWVSVDGHLVLPAIPFKTGHLAEVYLGLRPEHIEIVGPDEPASGALHFSAKVHRAELLGADALLTLNVNDIELLARVGGNNHPLSGDKVDIRFIAAHLHAFDHESEQALERKWMP